MRSITDYTVGWICVVDVELDAARAALDHVHPKLHSLSGDDNVYIYGSIGPHNIVIAPLPSGTYGTNAAAAVARDMSRSFPNLRFGLLVGVGGGVPKITGDSDTTRDIRLGDVVVSNPDETSSGVIQYDLGKQIEGQSRLKIVGSLNMPPRILRNAVRTLKNQYWFNQRSHNDTIQKLIERHPFLYPKFSYQGAENDILFNTASTHKESNSTCDECDKSVQIQREDRSHGPSFVHYGTIASGNQVVKDSVTRDYWRDVASVLCFEMEAAGLMNEIPCLVIRGVCDYADSHKNKKWQPYAALAASAYARDLLLEIQPNTTGNTGEAIGGSSDTSEFTKEEKDCLRSLSFNELALREDSIESPHPGTLTWIAERPEYKSWIEWQNNTQTERLLWIKGKPGSGKSVLMKNIIKKARDDQPECFTISFFVNGRGGPLEKTLLGLFRSLLHQMFRSQRPLLTSFMPKFREKRDTQQEGWQWHEEELRHQLFTILEKGQRSTSVFIDALDELEKEKDARRLVQLFADLLSRTHSNEHVLNICLSSRHYPHINLPGCRELSLDLWNSSDIMRYVEAKLCLEGEDANDLQQEVTEKASGVFLWVCLAIESLLTQNDEGRTVKEMRQELHNVPQELNELFTKYFESVTPRDRPETVRLMQWILFAQRPLTVTEVSWALFYSSPCPPMSFTAWHDDFANNAPRIEKRLRSLSRGLVEVKMIESGQLSVQFIHESVREFLLHCNGMHILDPALNQQMLGQSHDLLAKSCFDYLNSEEFLTASDFFSDKLPWKFRTSALLDYAARHVFEHSSKAELGGIQQSHLVTRLLESHQNEIKIWIYFRNEFPLIRLWDIHGVEAVLFRIATDYGLESCVEELVARGFDINTPGGSYGFAFIAAAAQGHTQMVKLLLKYGADRTVKDRSGLTALHWAVHQGYDETISTLLHEGLDVQETDNWGETVLHQAAISENVTEAVEQLIRDRAVDLDAINSAGQTALHYAAQYTSEYAIQLLQAGANSALVDETGKTTLHYAASCRTENLRVIELLIEHGADTSARDTRGNTPLHDAISQGCHLKNVDILMKANANIFASNVEGLQPIHMAAFHGKLDTLEHLINAGANISVQSENGQQPIHFAAFYDDGTIVARLVELGANVDAKDKRGRQAIHLAVCKGNATIFNKLVNLGADYHAQDDNGYQPIHEAARNHDSMIFDQLLDLGANYSSETLENRQPIHIAAFEGCESIINRLIDIGANLEAKDILGCQAIHLAAKRGSDEIVTLLLRQGIDATAKNVDGNQPIHLAAREGYVECLKALTDLNHEERSAEDDTIAEAYAQLQRRNRKASLTDSMSHQKLSKQVVDLNARNNLGETALYIAAMADDLHFCQKLISYGANVDAQDTSGKTALMIAAENEKLECIELLSKLNADPFLVDNRGCDTLSRVSEATAKDLLATWKSNNESG